MDSPKYARFNVQSVTYSKVYNHEVKAYILIPKTISAEKKHPVIVKFHGGGLVSGSGIFADWFQPWILELALQNEAIIIAPNYRLLPESSLLDMLADTDSFWKWLRDGSFQAALPSTVEVDVDRTLLYGDSAGGYVAIQSALRQPSDFVRAVVAAYPMIDLEDEYYNTESEKHAFGVPTLPKALLENHLKAMNPDPTKRELISDTEEPMARMALVLSAVQQGRLMELCGEDDRVYPFRVVRKREEKIPFLFFIHGADDDAVLVSDSVKFAGELEKKFSAESFQIHIEPGAGHGFDGEANLETEWLKNSLTKIKALWLS